MVTDRGGEEGHVEAEPFPTVTTNISDNQQQTSKKGEKKHNVLNEIELPEEDIAEEWIHA